MCSRTRIFAPKVINEVLGDMNRISIPFRRVPFKETEALRALLIISGNLFE
jgi:hypothetical protein